MAVSERTPVQPVAELPPSRASGPGTTTQAMKDAVKRPTAFDRFADWVSEAMGRPLNIIFWLVLVVTWTLLFALGGPHLASGSWLPSWFTSQGYNFPLNLITTVAELFIGFLVATAANRAQNALTALLDKIDLQEEQIEATEANIVTLIGENTDLTKEISVLTKEIHALTTQVAKNAALIVEIRASVSALAVRAGVATDGSSGAGAPPTGS